jgi:hypothetical protein
MLAAHRAAIDEPAAIWLLLGYGYAWPAGLKVRRESTAIARWPDHDASVALSPPKAAATRGVNRPGFDAASFLEEDANHAQQVPRRTAAARDPDGS